MVENPIKATIKKKREGTYLPFDEIHHLFMPYQLHWTCPGCKEIKIVDFEDQDFEYPQFNDPFTFTVYCEECDVENKKCEYEIKLQLNLSYRLTLEIPTAPKKKIDVEELEKKAFPVRRLNKKAEDLEKEKRNAKDQ